MDLLEPLIADEGGESAAEGQLAGPLPGALPTAEPNPCVADPLRFQQSPVGEELRHRLGDGLKGPGSRQRLALRGRPGQPGQKRRRSSPLFGRAAGRLVAGKERRLRDSTYCAGFEG